jgi:transposase
MVRAEVLQGVREMRFEALLDRHERGELNQREAAEMLGIGERTFRRWRDRLRDEGLPGLRDRRIGKPSSRRAAVEEIQRMLGLYEERYEGFTVKHFHEQLVKRHNYKLGYTVTRLSLHGAGLVRPAPKRSAHRKKRPRRPLVGMMLHQDASRFAWLPGDARQYDLVVTLDDATSAVYSAFLVEEEGTASSFRGLAEVIDRHGLFCELYTDRGSHYFHTPKAGEPVSKKAAQPGRAGAGAARHPPYRGLLARGARPFRAGLPHPAGPPAEGAGAGRHRDDRGGQPVDRRKLSAGAQRHLRDRAGRGGQRLCPRPRRRGARGPVHPGRAPGRQRQHRQMARPDLADPAEPAAAAFRARQRAGA